MEALEKIKAFIEELEEKDFYTYLAATLGVLLLMVIFVIFQYYSTLGSLRKQIKKVNELRQEARTILGKNEQVERQRAEVNTVLAEDEKFKIGDYFEKVLTKLSLSEKPSTAISHIDRDVEYRESVLKAEFFNMNMKQLCELLNEVEQNKRIYTKELEITKSKKIPRAIEVKLTIATLQHKSQPTELAE